MECSDGFTGKSEAFPVYMWTKRTFQARAIDLDKNGVEAEINGHPVILDHFWKEAAVLEAIRFRRQNNYRPIMEHVPIVGVEVCFAFWIPEADTFPEFCY